MPEKSSKSDSKSNEKCEYGERFRTFRARSGLKQAELAALLEAHPNYISQIERGEKTPGSRLIKEFRVLEEAPLYQSAQYSGETQGMPPPHVLPRATSPGAVVRPPSSHENYAEAVHILGHLLKHNPEALDSLMFTLRAVYEASKK